jgi:enolase
MRQEVKEGARGGTMGSPASNQLLRIEEELGDDAVYPGWSVFPRAAR